ncbi:MFS transporter [Cuniculiplasma sp. SKW3]|uniref:MFS transporter n=1 Tax=unclassified Cuniculiplasma TaxID=2619706 RepID=UPI003FCF2973
MEGSSTLGLMKRKGIIVVSLNQFIRVLARSQMWIFLPLYLLEKRGIPYITIGIVIFLMAIISLPLTLVSGVLIDKKGARKVISYSNFFLTILLFLLTISVFLSFSVYIIYLLLIASEPLMNIIGASDNVLISNSTSFRERDSAFSIVRIFQNLGFSIGPSIGGFIAGVGFGYIFLITAISSIFELSIYVRYLPRDSNKYISNENATSSDLFNAFRYRPFFIASILISLFYLILGQWGTTLSLFWKMADGMTNFQIGLLYSVNGIVVTLGQIPMNRLVKSRSEIVKLNLGYLLYLGAFSLLSFFNGFSFLILDTIIITLGENLMSPSINTIISRISPPGKRGQYFTSFQVLTGLIYPIAPVIGTIFLTIYSKDLRMMWIPFMVIGSLFFIIFVPLWNKIRLAEHTN